MNRYLLRYEKTGAARFIGHIDFIRMFQRAVKRASLPAAYTNGYNPRMQISFALPLPIGCAGHSEYAEIFLTEHTEPGEMIAELNDKLPDGIKIKSARLLCEHEKGPASALRAAAYEAELFGVNDLRSCVSEYLKNCADEARPISLDAAGNKIKMTVPQGNVKNLKPDAVVTELHSLTRTEYIAARTSYTRLEMYKEREGALTPIFDE